MALSVVSTTGSIWKCCASLCGDAGVHCGCWSLLLFVSLEKGHHISKTLKTTKAPGPQLFHKITSNCLRRRSPPLSIPPPDPRIQTTTTGAIQYSLPSQLPRSHENCSSIPIHNASRSQTRQQKIEKEHAFHQTQGWPVSLPFGTSGQVQTTGVRNRNERHRRRFLCRTSFTIRDDQPPSGIVRH